MKIKAYFFRLLFRSPWFFLVFFIIPFAVIFSVVFHIKLPFTSSTYPLLANNAIFSLLVLLRLFYYLTGLTQKFRYGGPAGLPSASTTVPQPADRVRTSLSSAGYLFAEDGGYGEKHDYGYVGTLLVYAGLILVLFTGTLDNLFHFSGTIRDGVGLPTDLQKLEAFKKVSAGPLVADLSALPQMRIVKQFFPNTTYPRGAAEVAFKFPGGKEQQVVLKPLDPPFQAGAYDIYMSKMVYEPTITITIDKSKPVFTGRVALDQLPENVNGFSFFGTFNQGLIDGKVYFKPENSRLKVIVNQGAQELIDAELAFQLDRLSRAANFTIMCENMGVWSEIYVVHKRHMVVVYFGGIVALMGLLIRIAIRPQRVWLEQTPDGCRVWTVGASAMKFLSDK
jgi:hypothetical protein